MPPLPPSPTSSPGDRPAALAAAAAADAARGASPRASASPAGALASASSLTPAPADWAWLPAASVPEWEHILGTASRTRSSGGGSGNGGSPGGGGFSLGSGGGGGGDASGDGAPWPLRLRIVHEWRAAPGGGSGSGSRGSSSGAAGGSSRPLRALVPSSDEAFAVAVASTVRVWHLGGPACVAEYAQHAGAPTAAALLPTRLFASAAASSSAAGLGLFASAELHAALVVSGDATGALHVWRAASGERIAVLQDASGSSSSGGGASFSASSSPSSSALSPAASPTATAAAAPAASGASAAVSASSDDAAVTCLRALDGGWGGRVVAGLQDGRLRFADAAAGRALHAWRVAPPGSEAGGAPAVRSLALCPGAAAPTQPLGAEPPSGAGDGAAYIAAGLSSGVITLLDARAGGVVRPFGYPLLFVCC
jgi:hypothetical protein